jgi:hypothetical protein
MPLSKSDSPGASVLPPSEPDPAPSLLEADVVAKTPPPADSDAADTPSGHALRAVGKPTKAELSGDDPEKARERGAKYREEKAKKRWLS